MGRIENTVFPLPGLSGPSLNGELSHIGDTEKVGRRGPDEKGNQISEGQNDN
jgi:hypothetical protein